MDWSDNNSCIKCDKGGNLLVCSEDGCPIAVHAGCLGCPARFDDANHFHCPYCLYKHAVAESRKAREHALARKKALSIFMDGKVVGGEKHMEENKTREDDGHNQSKTSDANVNFTSCGNGRGKSNNYGILDQPSQLDGEKISNAEENSEASAGSKGQDPSVKVHGENSNRTEEEKQVQEEECKKPAEEQAQEEGRETSIEEEKTQEEEHENSVEEVKTQEEEPETSIEEEKAQEEERETSVEEEKTQEDERETSVEEDKTQEEKCETSIEEEKNQEEERETSLEEEKNQEEERETSVEEEKTQEEERETSVEEEKTQEVVHETSVEEEKIQEEESEASSASTDQGPSLAVHARAKRESKRSKPMDTDSDSDPVQSKLFKHAKKKKKTSPLTVNPTRRSSRKSSSALGTEKVVNEEVGSPRRLKKPERPSAKLTSNIYGSPKRKRLPWREEEETAIRAGVEKYSKEGSKLPWKKILDMFKHKFDATRTPGDLKDKWRNMSRW